MQSTKIIAPEKCYIITSSTGKAGDYYWEQGVENTITLGTVRTYPHHKLALFFFPLDQDFDYAYKMWECKGWGGFYNMGFYSYYSNITPIREIDLTSVYISNIFWSAISCGAYVVGKISNSPEYVEWAENWDEMRYKVGTTTAAFRELYKIKDDETQKLRHMIYELVSLWGAWADANFPSGHLAGLLWQLSPPIVIEAHKISKNKININFFIKKIKTCMSMRRKKNFNIGT